MSLRNSYLILCNLVAKTNSLKRLEAIYEVIFTKQTVPTEVISSPKGDYALHSLLIRKIDIFENLNE